MFKTKKKIMALLVGALLVLTFSLSSTGIAQGATNVLQVQFKNIKILFNGQEATLGTQPLIVNGSTYLPVRALANLFKMNINWDAVKQQITITNTEVTNLQAQIAQKDLQIKALQAQLDAEDMDIDDLEEQLNDDYEDYEDMEWTISLSGDEDDVKVTVKTDLDDYDDEWDDLSDSDIEDFLQDICDDILDVDAFEDADITGTIKDSSTGDELVSFETSSSGTVSLNSSGDLGDLEDELNDEYTDLGDIDDLSIELDGDEDEITFSVYIDYDEFDADWDELANADVITFMEDIQDDIEAEFDDADVDGEILDSSDNDDEMATYSSSNAFSRPYPQQ